MRYVVLPDIHGEYGALGAMLRHCGAVDGDLRFARPGFTLVQLGDLVDRGPRPRACVELMMALVEAGGGRVVVLKGNHEDLLLEAPYNTSARATWLMNGGGATLKDYGEAGLPLIEPGGAHFAWLAARPVQFEAEGVFFCHGGITKGNYKAMDPHRLMWDRPPLYRGPYKAMVCGHTPTSSGRIEEDGGVFRCDIGLGYGRGNAPQYLVLDAEAGGLRHEIVTV